MSSDSELELFTTQRSLSDVTATELWKKNWNLYLPVQTTSGAAVDNLNFCSKDL